MRGGGGGGGEFARNQRSTVLKAQPLIQNAFGWGWRLLVTKVTLFLKLIAMCAVVKYRNKQTHVSASCMLRELSVFVVFWFCSEA